MDNHPIVLNQLLGLTDDELSRTKIRFNMNNGHVDPIEIFKNNPEEVNTNWFLFRSEKSVFRINDIAVSLVRITRDEYLLTTVKTITSDSGIHQAVSYSGEEWKHLSCYYGRVIVSFHKRFQTPVVNASTVIDRLEVTQILPDLFDDNHFPGYDSVRLSYAALEHIIRKELPDWIGALENQKAVYLITDLKTGKLYVGSATSDRGMLLTRWRQYVETGHGEDVALIDLVNTEGFEYIKENFQYSILENYNARVDDSIILARESWWKLTLGSRVVELGYNRN